MISNPSSLLFYPFEKEALAQPAAESKTLFWNMRYVEGVQDFINFDCVQSFKPYSEAWKACDINVLKEAPSNTSYTNIFIVLPKQKEAALYMMAQAFAMLEEDGLLVCVAANDAGGKNIQKWMVEMGAAPTSLSKSKCRIVWAYKKDINIEAIQSSIQKGKKHEAQIEGQKFTTQAGIFGWNKIDKGSKLLLQNLPDDLKGVGADFGCGYGYLSLEILQNNTQIKKLYALEADYNALACAQENLQIYEENVEVYYSWADLRQAQPRLENLDWVVMNPPFHEGKKIDSDVGQDFIEQAAQTLKKRGLLYMVANAHLPYEKTLEKLFPTVTKICEEQGYKIFIAQK